MTLTFALLIVKGAFAKIEPNTKIVINLFILILIVWFMETVLNDLFIILVASVVGYIMYIPFNIIATKNGRRATVLEDELIKEEVKKERRGNV